MALCQNYFRRITNRHHNKTREDMLKEPIFIWQEIRKMFLRKIPVYVERVGGVLVV